MSFNLFILKLVFKKTETTKCGHPAWHSSGLLDLLQQGKLALWLPRWASLSVVSFFSCAVSFFYLCELPECIVLFLKNVIQGFGDWSAELSSTDIKGGKKNQQKNSQLIGLTIYLCLVFVLNDCSKSLVTVFQRNFFSSNILLGQASDCLLVITVRIRRIYADNIVNSFPSVFLFG